MARKLYICLIATFCTLVVLGFMSAKYDELGIGESTKKLAGVASIYSLENISCALGFDCGSGFNVPSN